MVALESFDGNRWRAFSRTTTSRTGVAMWTIKLGRGTFKLRAHYGGSYDLADAVSSNVTVRVR